MPYLQVSTKFEFTFMSILGVFFSGMGFVSVIVIKSAVKITARVWHLWSSFTNRELLFAKTRVVCSCDFTS